jgi:transcriptional regulator with XRE-family HTH domain
MNADVHPLIKALVNLRYLRGLTQQNVADQLFLPRSAIGKFETNTRQDHNLVTVERYARAVGAELVVMALPTVCQRVSRQRRRAS